MRLLVDNLEVTGAEVDKIPSAMLETICQLLGIPFRHDPRIGVFSVYPPLAGKKVFVGVSFDRSDDGGRLKELFLTETRALKHLLWLAGADISMEEVPGPDETASSFQRKHVLRDVAVFLHGGIVLPGLDSVVVYPWWERFSLSHRLAECLVEVIDRDGGAWLRKIPSSKLPGPVKTWFSEFRETVPGAAVLLSVPLVEGYSDPLVQRMASLVADGLLMFFDKPVYPAWVREAVAPAWTGPEGRPGPAIGVAEAVRAEPPASQSEPGAKPVPASKEPPEPTTTGEPGPPPSPEVAGPRVPPGQGAGTGVSPGPVTPARPLPHAGYHEPGTPHLAEEDIRTRVARDLAARGIKPTPELVEEYVLYLRRMGTSGGSEEMK